MRKKIIYLHNTLGVGGGAEALRFTMIKYINKEKYDIRLCCLIRKGEIAEDIERLGFKVDLLNASDKIHSLATIIKLYIYLLRNRVDILQTAFFNVNLLGTIAGILAGVPKIIVEEHSYYERYNPRLGFILRRINRCLAKYTYKIIACADIVATRISVEENIPPHKFCVIPNTVDPERMKPGKTKESLRRELNIEEGEIIIGFIASFAPRKGHIFLIDALQKCINEVSNIKMLLVGTGVLKNEIEAIVEKKGLSEYIRFLGLRQDIPDIISLFDIYVQPSLAEAFSISITEAMSMGVPCIVTDVGGNREIIGDDGCGILVPPRNPDALKDAIIKLAHDTNLRKRMGKAAAERIYKEFSPQRYIHSLEELYDN
jgi:glycosyltransferase involved in cell wall biosynthesis